MAVDLNDALDELHNLWTEYGTDFADYDLKAIHFLERHFGNVPAPSGRPGHLRGVRILYGQGSGNFNDGVFEEAVGSLLAIVPGIVYLRPDWRVWDLYSGLLQRQPENPRGCLFHLTSVIDPSASLSLLQATDGSAVIEHGSGYGHSSAGSQLFVSADRWSRLKSWLDIWLPEEAAT